MRKRKTPPAGGKADDTPTNAVANRWEPPLDHEGQWWIAQFSIPQNAIKDLWERFSKTPFTYQRLCNWLATQGINEVDAREMPLAEVRRMLEAELAKRALAGPKGEVPLNHTAVAKSLTDAQQAVFDAIRDNGPVQGKDICILAGVELGNLKNHILPALRKQYTIYNRSGAGYCSLDPRYEMAERYRSSGKHKLIVLMLGDFDPEGEDICHSFARSMRDDFEIENIEAIKVALTAVQVREYRLPKKMTAKETSARRDKFVKAYGDNVWEIEALSPATLRQILTAAIKSVLCMEAYNHEVGEEHEDASHLEAYRMVAINTLRGNDTEN